jgi:hypothetical protein
MCECKAQLDRVEAKLDAILADHVQVKDALRSAASNPMLGAFLPKF